MWWLPNEITLPYAKLAAANLVILRQTKLAAVDHVDLRRVELIALHQLTCPLWSRPVPTRLQPDTASSISLSLLWALDHREERGESSSSSSSATRSSESIPSPSTWEFVREGIGDLIHTQRESGATLPTMREAALPLAVSGVGGEASVASGHLRQWGKGGGEGMRGE